jgi:hypothetical protein
MPLTLVDYLLLWQVVMFFGVPLALLIFVFIQEHLDHH